MKHLTLNILKYMIIILIFASCNNQNEEKNISEKKYSIEEIELSSFNLHGEWEIKLDYKRNARFKNVRFIGGNNVVVTTSKNVSFVIMTKLFVF